MHADIRQTRLLGATWVYEGGATTPFHIWGEFSDDGGTTWSEPVLVGVASPGERQFVYRNTRLNFDDANAMDRYVVIALNHKDGSAYRIPRAGYDGKIDADWVPDMTGATVGANGAHGLVPAPVIADRLKYLRGDGTWQTVSGGRRTSMRSASNAALRTPSRSDWRWSGSMPPSA